MNSVIINFHQIISITTSSKKNTPKLKIIIKHSKNLDYSSHDHLSYYLINHNINTYFIVMDFKILFILTYYL